MAANKKKAAKKTATKRRNGRPTKYTKELGDEICRRLAEGESLRAICRDDRMPHLSNVLRWATESRTETEGFREQYASAREIQAEIMSEEIIEIADDSSRDMVEDDEGNERPDHEAIQRAKLRVDTRKWIMSKRASKRFGDKQQVEHQGDGLKVMLNYDTSAGQDGE